MNRSVRKLSTSIPYTPKLLFEWQNKVRNHEILGHLLLLGIPILTSLTPPELVSLFYEINSKVDFRWIRYPQTSKDQ